jgi:glycerophosphoryl diester phosphodiesterase
VTDVYAHRGLHQTQRENTLEAFRAAVALGVDGVELDVRRTVGGALVVHHDPAIGELVIAEAGQGELPDYVPTLEQTMDALIGVRVNVEIKNVRDRSEPTYDETGDFARQVVSFLREARWAPAVIISCFDLATCGVVRSFDADIAIGWLLWGVDLSSAMVQARAMGLNAVHPYFTTLSAPAIVQARELGLALNVWTVNGAEDIVAMAALGVDSIITDDPALALQLLG